MIQVKTLPSSSWDHSVTHLICHLSKQFITVLENCIASISRPWEFKEQDECVEISATSLAPLGMF